VQTASKLTILVLQGLFCGRMQGIWTGTHFQLIHVLSSCKVHLEQFLALKTYFSKTIFHQPLMKHDFDMGKS
jgi:hypothetical protein